MPGQTCHSGEPEGDFPENMTGVIPFIGSFTNT